MEHPHKTETPGAVTKSDHSKMDHGAMQHGTGSPMNNSEHDHQKPQVLC